MSATIPRRCPSRPRRHARRPSQQPSGLQNASPAERTSGRTPGLFLSFVAQRRFRPPPTSTTQAPASNNSTNQAQTSQPTNQVTRPSNQAQTNSPSNTQTQSANPPASGTNQAQSPTGSGSTNVNASPPHRTDCQEDHRDRSDLPQGPPLRSAVAPSRN